MAYSLTLSNKNDFNSLNTSLLQFFWLSLACSTITAILSYIFGVQRSPLLMLSLPFLAAITVLALLLLRNRPSFVTPLARLISLVGMLGSLSTFTYLLYNERSGVSMLEHHLEFGSLIFFTPLLYIWLLTSFHNYRGVVLTLIFYVSFLFLSLPYFLGFSPHSKDAFLYGEVITLLFVSAAYIMTFVGAARLVESQARDKADATLRLAYQDNLTGLPNRVFLQQKLLQMIKETSGKFFYLLIIDLDRFKPINNNFGANIGDLFLQEVAKRLKNVVRNQDILARIAADEFAIILQAKSGFDVDVFFKRVKKVFQMPFTVERVTLPITASIGMSAFPEHGNNAQILLSKADIAVRRAKLLGRNRIQTYDEKLGKEVEQRFILEQELRFCLEKKRVELELYYQPIIEVSSKRIISCEALLRWNHSKKGMIFPDIFVPIAEESGLITELGEWVLHEACKQLKVWHKEGFELCIAVNVSAAQFAQPKFPNIVRKVLETYKLKACSLELEMTESMVMESGAAGPLEALKKLGCTIELDDFGTGYSSLAALHSLNLDGLKIDRSFIQRLQEDYSESQVTVKTIIALARSLGLHIVAEGVEQEQQFDFLHQLSCDRVQGYLFSKPVPASDFRQLLLESYYT